MKAVSCKRVRSLIFVKGQQTLSSRNSSTRSEESPFYETNMENREPGKIVSIPLLFLRSCLPDHFFFSFWSASRDRLKKIHGIVRARRNRTAHTPRGVGRSRIPSRHGWDDHRLAGAKDRRDSSLSGIHWDDQ